MRIERDARLIDQIKRHEGLRLRAYRCPAGKLTIGWGHNLTDNPVWGLQKGDKISQTSAERLLTDDIYAAARQLDERLTFWRTLDAPRQAVLLNMAFQLGIGGLCGFLRALHAIELSDWDGAAAHMLDSKWAREDSPNRAQELARQMQTGEWQEA